MTQPHLRKAGRLAGPQDDSELGHSGLREGKDELRQSARAIRCGTQAPVLAAPGWWAGLGQQECEHWHVEGVAEPHKTSCLRHNSTASDLPPDLPLYRMKM